MTKSAKFLEDNTIALENVQDFVQENNDFLVVGIIGAQGVGKSTVLNLLAHNQVTDELKKAVFNDLPQKGSEDCDSFKVLNDKISQLKVSENNRNIDNVIFNTRQVPVEANNNITDGIDIFITSNRVSIAGYCLLAYIALNEVLKL